MDAAYIANVEIVGSCNLRCPACAVGNYLGPDRRLGNIGGAMPLARFEAILDKLAKEAPAPPQEVFVALYSWGEPLIHPQIGKFIRAAKQRGFRVSVSSNLNYARHLEKMALAEPDEICISLSGFSQETYGRSHKGGDIELVKTNMRLLADLCARHDLTTKVIVTYHLYRHNVGRDLVKMADFADRLRFTFNPVWALMLPLEKLLRARRGEVAEPDRPMVDNLLLHPDEQFAIAKERREAQEHCELQSARIDIDVDGAVKLCCGTFERASNIAEDFLAVSLPDLHRRKESSATCDECLGCGAHRIFLGRDVGHWMETAGGRIAAAGFVGNAGLGRVDSELLEREQDLQQRMIRPFLDKDAAAYAALREKLAERLELKYGYPAIDFEQFLARFEGKETWRRGFHGPLDPLRLYFMESVTALRQDRAAPWILERLHVLAQVATAWNPGDRHYLDTAAEIAARCRKRLAA